MSPSPSISLSTPLPRTAGPPKQQQHRDGYLDQDSMMNPMRQYLSYSNQSSPVDDASLSSCGSVRYDGGSGNGGRGSSASSSRTSIGSHAEFLKPGMMTTAAATTTTTTTTTTNGPYHHHQQDHHVDGGTASYSYYLDRGNGQVTRLIPADVLPPMVDVMPREEEHESMIILTPLEQLQTLGGTVNKESNKIFSSIHKSSMVLPDNLQHQIDCIVATSPKPSNKRVKVYCDKWIHEGVCAFTQQGCKFKHEMPQDEATQRSLGLFHGFPAWWKKRAEEQRRELVGSGGTSNPGLTTLSVLSTPMQSSLGSRASLAESDGIGRHRGQQTNRPNLEKQHEHQYQGHEHHQFLQYRHPGFMNDVKVGYGQAAAGFAPIQAGRRAMGSQWMQNGIVPFARGPRR